MAALGSAPACEAAPRNSSPSGASASQAKALLGKKSRVQPHGFVVVPGTLRGHLAFAPQAYGKGRGRRAGGVDLVGDPYSGYGFYPLPIEIRIAAARYRQRYGSPWWRNPVLAAVAADALRTPCYIPANQGYRCGVFNPIDGVGTPFFAGYYSRAW